LPLALVLNFFIGCQFFLYFFFILTCIVRFMIKIDLPSWRLFWCSCMQCSFICWLRVFYFLAGRAFGEHACEWTWNGDPLCSF